MDKLAIEVGRIIDGYVPSDSDQVSIVGGVFMSGSSLSRTETNLATTGAELPVSYLLSIGDITRQGE